MFYFCCSKKTQKMTKIEPKKSFFLLQQENIKIKTNKIEKKEKETKKTKKMTKHGQKPFSMFKDHF